MKKLLLSLASLCMAFSMNAQYVFQEDFTTNTQLTGWTIYEDNLANYGNYSQFGQGWFVTNYTSEFGNAAVSISYTTQSAPCDRWLITPAITLPSDGNNALMFDNWGYDASFPEALEIMISTTGVQKSDFTTIKDTWELAPGMHSDMVDLSDYAGQTIYIAFINEGDGYYVGIDNIKIGVPPMNEIKMESVNMPAYVGMSVAQNVSISVTNKGMGALTSFDAQYSINGGTPVVEHVSGINVAYNQTITYTFNAPFQQADEGNYTVAASVSNPNGEADDASDNDASCSVAVYNASLAVTRTTLLEHFTTAQCPNCPGGDDRLHQATSGRNDVIWLSHHAGYYTDNMTVSENNTLLAFFNDGGGTYAPGMMLNRSVEFGDGPNTPVQVPGYPQEITSLLDAAQAVPSFVTVDITNMNYNRDSRQLTATVAGQMKSTTGLTNPRVSLYIMEDSIYGTQSGASGKIYHMHVMRHAISDVWGDALNADANGNYSVDYTYTLPATYNAKNCKLIAFVSNYNANNILDCRVSNAKQTGYITTAAAGIDEISDNVEMNVYPNPTTTVLNVAAASEIRDVRIMNVLGQEVYANSNVNAQTLQVNTTAFAAGMYVVTVKTNDGIATRRINVVR